jgi:hypothetical protein
VEPRADRPHMPGYGIADAPGGTGLLPWSWAEERLRDSHDYWVATVGPDGRPGLTPVWGAWLDDALWFSSARASRKSRNIAAGSRVAVSTDRAHDPVVIEGTPERIVVAEAIAAFTAATNAKYGVDYGVDFYDPAVNATFRVSPRWAFGLDEDDFTGSPTRWRFT